MKLSLILFVSLMLSVAKAAVPDVSSTVAKSPGCDPEIHVCTYAAPTDRQS